MVIVDASVAFKWFLNNEEDIDQALTILTLHQNEQNIILVPDLLFYELANAWVTKTALTVKGIKTFLNDLQNINLKIGVVNFDLLNQAAVLSKKYKISLYDATYLALAKQKKCLLITADQKLIGKVNLPFVKLLQDYSV